MDLSKAEMDRQLALMRDTLPRVWWSVYQGCLQVGFDSAQSFALTTTYILGQNPQGIRPSEPTAPRPNVE